MRKKKTREQKKNKEKETFRGIEAGQKSDKCVQNVQESHLVRYMWLRPFLLLEGRIISEDQKNLYLLN